MWHHYCIIFTGTLSKTFSVSPNDSHVFDFISQFCSLGNYNLGVAQFFFLCPGCPQLWHDHQQWKMCHGRSGPAWPRNPSSFSDLLMECHCDSKWSLKTTIRKAYFIIPGFFFTFGLLLHRTSGVKDMAFPGLYTSYALFFACFVSRGDKSR